MFVLVLGYILFGGRTSRAARAFERAQALPWDLRAPAWRSVNDRPSRFSI